MWATRRTRGVPENWYVNVRIKVLRYGPKRGGMANLAASPKARLVLRYIGFNKRGQHLGLLMQLLLNPRQFLTQGDILRFKLIQPLPLAVDLLIGAMDLRANNPQFAFQAVTPRTVRAQFILLFVILLEKIIESLRQITVLRHADSLICGRIGDQLLAIFLHFTIHGEIKHSANYRSAPAPLL